MSKEFVNIGSGANDGTGDPLRTAFSKLNAYLAEHDAADNQLSSRVATLEQANNQYAPVNHTHDERYAFLTHRHDDLYAATTHRHDDLYATKDHTHAGVYAPFSHTHTDYLKLVGGYADVTQLPEATETALGAVRKGTLAAARAGTSNSVVMTPLLTKEYVSGLNLSGQSAGNSKLLTGPVEANQTLPSAATQTVNDDYSQYLLELKLNTQLTFASSQPNDVTVSFNIWVTQDTTGGRLISFPNLTGWLEAVPAIAVPANATPTVTSPYLDRGARSRGLLTVVRMYMGSTVGSQWFAAWTKIAA